MEKVDIFITSYLRNSFTAECLKYIKERTKYPYKLTLIDNGGNSQFKNEVDHYFSYSENVGIHWAWNTALALSQEKYFVTCDNDLLAPELEPDWLSQMVGIMEENPEYGAISMHPHVFIGAVGINPGTPEFEQDVIERNMCGAVFRIMRTELVKQAGGWEFLIRSQRNHEERTICSRLQTLGYKVGITPKIRAYHMFGINWGYDEEFTPEMQGHTPELKDYVTQFDNREAYDPKTWLPK